MPETNYFWDDVEDNIVEEYDEVGVTTANYTTEPDRFGNVISQRRDGESRLFHYDAIGSTLAVTNDSQSITDTFKYTAFGDLTERTGSSAIAFQFAGQKGYYYLALTNQHIVRRRCYEPSRAVWLSADPLGILYLMSQSRYMYVENSPTIGLDPSGLWRVVGTTRDPFYIVWGRERTDPPGPRCAVIIRDQFYEHPCPPRLPPDDPEGPSYLDGLNKLFTGISMLQEKCEKCCNSACTMSQCKDGAYWLVFRLMTAWQMNYGGGPHQGPGSHEDPVGGHYCWDWAEIYYSALGQSPSDPPCFYFHKWAARSGSVNPDGMMPVHYYLWVYVGREETACAVIFDDGFFDHELAHDGIEFLRPWIPTDPTQIPPSVPLAPTRPVPF